jgi:hypothetical protein
LTKIFLRSIKFPIKHNLLKEFWQLKKKLGGSRKIFSGWKFYPRKKFLYFKIPSNHIPRAKNFSALLRNGSF